MKDIEIEIQVRVGQTKKLLEFLESNAQFVAEEYQKDEYFTPAHRDFAAIKPIAEWLRLRESGKGSITYKNWHYGEDGKSTHCDEYETKVDDIDQMRKIFSVLDIKPVIVVEKTRKTWVYENYEIALDQITDLGEFVEIEYKGDAVAADSERITKEMVVFLKELDCGTIERNNGGYPFMILYPGEVKFEEL